MQLSQQRGKSIMKLEYKYSTRIKFSSDIERHNILLRCQPANEVFQKVVSEMVYFDDGYWLKEGHDGFGNRVISGGTNLLHSTLKYTSLGVVEQTTYCIPDPVPHPMFSLPSALTGLSQLPTLNSNMAFLDRCFEIMHLVHHHIDYTCNVTTMQTTAMDVWNSKKGVCQDYAHLMVALCRAAGMPARYVCGLMSGEGQTHAWVEVHDGMCWYAFDPTNDTAIANGYIKLAHGRDALDCPVSRGTYRISPHSVSNDMPNEQSFISVMVKEIK